MSGLVSRLKLPSTTEFLPTNIIAIKLSPEITMIWLVPVALNLSYSSRGMPDSIPSKMPVSNAA
jgi:hypothetical protein